MRVNVIHIGGGNSADFRLDMEVENKGMSGLNRKQWKTLLNMLNDQKLRINEGMMGK